MGEIVLGDFSLQFSLNNPVSCIHALALAKLKRFNKVVMETDNLCEGVKVCLGNRIWIIYPLAETRLMWRPRLVLERWNWKASVFGSRPEFRWAPLPPSL
ncbi:unnamed protein product [Prunus armeniaca]